MSTTYEIYKFAKPTLKELSIVDYYSDYDVFSILDEDGDSTGEFISCSGLMKNLLAIL